MSESKFKVGDRVRLKEEFDIAINGYSTTIPIGEIGVVEDAYDDELYVYIKEHNIYLTLRFSQVDAVEPCDSKTAFLSELKELLARYDAKMSADVGGPDLDCAEVDMLFVIGNDEIRFDVSMFNCFITPDNIIESAYYEKR